MKKSDIIFGAVCAALVIWFVGQRVVRSHESKVWEKERQERIAKDFTRSEAEVRTYIERYIPDVTDDQIDEWTRSGKLENTVIDGQTRYFRNAAPNLFRIDSACCAVKAAAEGGEGISPHEYDDAEAIPAIIGGVRDNLFSGADNPYLAFDKGYCVRYTLIVKPDAVPAGETVRCWLPFPRSDVPRQGEVRLIQASEADYILSRPEDPHSTLYMEKKAVAGEPTVFQEIFRYSSSGEWHPLSEDSVKPYNKATREYEHYTAEREAHIRFTPAIRHLADSLSEGLENPYAIARRFFTYVNDNFPWASSREYSTMPNIPEYVLETGHGDCGMVTLLFITLCRCKGIPARWQSGFMMHPSGWNLHDWGEVYFEGPGWVPVDMSFGIPPYARRRSPLMGIWAPSGKTLLDMPEAEFFYLGGIDPYRMVVNSDYGAFLWPRKKFPRSETVDFQRGEVEWKGGNLYFDQWDYTLEIVPEDSVPMTDYRGLTSENHPRLFFSADDFKAIPKALRKRRNHGFCALSDQMITMAESAKYGLDPNPLEYRKDVSGKRILHISRQALQRIIPDAYAYRITGEDKYLTHAVADLNTVCDFPDWNPSHFLDTGEMSLAVAVGYDWLYEFLDPATKSKVENRLKVFGIDAAMNKYQGCWKGTNNWNQVCNAGIVAASLALYELFPDQCRFMIEEAVKSNRISVDFCYSPDGAYPEGPSYWEYGTTFQTILNTELETVLGSDFGLSDNEGFQKTGYFNLHCQDSDHHAFNYYDGGEGMGSRVALWYFARKFNDPGLLYTEKQFLENDGYVGNRQLFCGLANAWRCNFKEIPEPSENFYAGQGETPVAFFRTGWGPDDLWMGIKAGMAGSPHGHMDAGNFVFTGWGVRWAVDVRQTSYATLEKFFKDRGSGSLWKMGQDSDRWRLLCYNNRSHNTITVNDKDYDVSGRSTLDSTFRTPSRMGAVVDITPALGGELARAVRTAAIVDGKRLEIMDELTAPSDRPAHIRWNFITRASVEVLPEGLLLSQDGKQALLSASGVWDSGASGTDGGGASGIDGAGAPHLVYKTWPITLENAGLDPEYMLAHMKGHTICGFEFDLPAGASLRLLTTLRAL